MTVAPVNCAKGGAPAPGDQKSRESRSDRPNNTLDEQRRPVLAGIGAAAISAFFNPPPVRAQALDRPPSVLVFDVAESLLDLQVFRSLFQGIFGNGTMVDE